MPLRTSPSMHDLLLEDLVRSLPILADISHSELLLLVPSSGEWAEGKDFAPSSLLVIAHSKPSTAPFIYRRNREGEEIPLHLSPFLGEALRKKKIVKGREGEMVRGIPVWRWCAPILREDRVIALLEADQNLLQRRFPRPSPYLKRIASLLNEALFRSQMDEKVLLQLLKQGDGLVLREGGRIVFADKRARDIYCKVGIKSPVGKKLKKEELEGAVKIATQKNSLCTRQEIQIGNTIILKREIPLVRNFTLSILCDVSLLRKRLQERMLRSEVMQEIHHHIKNTLQTTISILRMQERRLNNETAKEALRSAINRLSSIATVHHLLSEEGIQAVDFRELVFKVAQNVLQSFPHLDVNLQVEGVSPLFPPSTASLLALVIDELLLNALQHAFSQKKGNIWVRLLEEDPNLVLEVKDDGKGLPASYVPGLGLSIVKVLAEDLGANFQIFSQNGTVARLAFPKEVGIWDLEY